MNYASIIFIFSLLITLTILIYFLINEKENKKIKNIILINLLTIVIYNCISLVIFKFSMELLLATFAFNHIVCFSMFVTINNNNKNQITKDQLTGLNNKNCLLQYIKKSPKKNSYLIIGDINKFKKINDTYGHLEGDNALKTVAKALLNIGKENPDLFISRFGGDEFVLIYKTNNASSVNRLIQKIHDEIDKEVKALSYSVSLSFGFSRLYKNNYKNSFKQADANMYKIKNNS